jgi:hypothetical protein
MRHHLELGEVEAAVAVYKKSSRSFANWALQESDWLELIQGLLDQEAWGEAASLMLSYIRQRTEPSARIQLKLAQVLVQKLARPLQAMAILNQIPDGALPQTLEPMRRKLTQQAQHMREEGDLELQDELW